MASPDPPSHPSFDARDNGITAGRLLLALTVVVSHAFEVGMDAAAPLAAETQQVSLGFMAVLGFFGLSGFLLARSRERTPIARFARNRLLRILPGYWLALLVGGFIMAPLGAAIVGQRVEFETAVGYVVSNLSLIIPGQTVIGPAFDETRVNGSLWTLGVEAWCYFMLAVTPVRWLKPVATGILVVFLALWANGPAMQGAETLLFVAFAAGACAYLWRIPVMLPLVALAAGLAVLALAMSLTPLAAVAIGYAAIGLARLPFRLERDLSYGVYVLAYPLQKVLALTVIPSFGVGAMIAASVLTVLPLAFLSWTFVEEPALRLRKLDIRMPVLGRGRTAREPQISPVADPGPKM